MKATGLYDEVAAYDDVNALPSSDTVCVDFAGNAGLLKSIHAHYGDALKYSCLVGATHVEGRGEGGGLTGITGPQPILFFAPDHAVAAIKESGPKAFGEAVAKSWQAFLNAVQGTLQIKEHNGISAAAEAFQAIYRNEADPSLGIVVRP